MREGEGTDDTFTRDISYGEKYTYNYIWNYY